MTQEEKARRYDEAIEIARQYYNDRAMPIGTNFKLERIFPELKESEDERIRKALIEYFNEQCDMSDWNGVYGYQVVAWLEKQGEHKKFRDSIQVGDNVTKNEDGVLVNLSQLNRVAKKQGEQKPTDNVETKFKVGDTIKLKNGDGLEWTVEQIQDNGWCTITCADRDDFILLDDKWELVEQKTVWSEEDEMFVHGLIRGLTAKRDIHGHTTFSSDCIDITKTIDWLKSLKDRVQPKQEWSEEDEITRNALINLVEMYYGIYFNKSEKNRLLSWLKSLILQNRWKPSDEQIEILDMVLTNESMDDNIARILRELREQLKKLKG